MSTKSEERSLLAFATMVSAARDHLRLGASPRGHTDDRSDSIPVRLCAFHSDGQPPVGVAIGNRVVLHQERIVVIVADEQVDPSVAVEVISCDVPDSCLITHAGDVRDVGKPAKTVVLEQALANGAAVPTDPWAKNRSCHPSLL